MMMQHNFQDILYSWADRYGHPSIALFRLFRESVLRRCSYQLGIRRYNKSGLFSLYYT